MHHNLIRHLVTVAAMAARERPGMAELFPLPSGNATTQDFRALARLLLERGRAERELLHRHGLGNRLLEDLAAALAELDASLIESNNGRLWQVEARAELKAVSDEIMRLMRTLDGINRYRFEGDRASLTVWESARHVVADPRAAGEPAGKQPAVPELRVLRERTA